MLYNYLKKKFLAKQKNFKDDIDANLLHGMVHIFKENEKQLPIIGSTAGCYVVDLKKGLIWPFNLGDTKIIGIKDQEIVFATNDHNVNNKNEQNRLINDHDWKIEYDKYNEYPPRPIKKNFGYLDLENDKIRTNSARSLRVTRSFGDDFFKYDEYNNDSGQTAVPEIYKPIKINEVDFMVTASDGLWENLTNKQVMDYIYKNLNQFDLHTIAQMLVIESALNDKNQKPLLELIGNTFTDLHDVYPDEVDYEEQINYLLKNKIINVDLYDLSIEEKEALLKTHDNTMVTIHDLRQYHEQEKSEEE